MIDMNKRKNRKLQKPMKVFMASAVLTTTLFTSMTVNGLNIHAETTQTQVQYEERTFELPSTGHYMGEAARERRSEQRNYTPTGIYVKPNEQVTIEVSGLSGLDKLGATIGTNEYDKEGESISSFPGF